MITVLNSEHFATQHASFFHFAKENLRRSVLPSTWRSLLRCAILKACPLFFALSSNSRAAHHCAIYKSPQPGKLSKFPAQNLALLFACGGLMSEPQIARCQSMHRHRFQFSKSQSGPPACQTCIWTLHQRWRNTERWIRARVPTFVLLAIIKPRSYSNFCPQQC